MSDHPEQPGRLVDFSTLARRFRRMLVVLAVLAAVAGLVDLVAGGSPVRVLVTWSSVFAGASVLGAAVLVGWSAAAGATVAEQRGERLASDDVGLVPPRRPRE